MNGKFEDDVILESQNLNRQNLQPFIPNLWYTGLKDAWDAHFVRIQTHP